MPSLWDLLCVSRQQKYSTQDERSWRRPHHRSPRQDPHHRPDDNCLQDNRYHDNRHHHNNNHLHHDTSSQVYHYIQPDIAFHHQRTSSTPTTIPQPQPPPPFTPHHRPAVHNEQQKDPRSPAVREDFTIPGLDDDPWLLGARTDRPQTMPSPPPPSSSPKRDAKVWDDRSVMRNEQGKLSMEPARAEAALSARSGAGADQHFRQSGDREKNRDFTSGSSGKRRHVREIFADMNYRQDVSRPQSNISVTSSPGHWDDWSRVGDLNVSVFGETSAHRLSSGSTQSPGQRLSSGSTQNPGQRLSSGSTQSPGKRLSSGSSQTPGQRLSSGSSQSPRPRETSRSKQISGFLQASESRPRSGLPLITAGSRPVSGSKPTESLYQYSPRTVSDTAVSAALFGNRIDDFVHDPGWNQAIDRFAAGPITTTTTPPAFFFGGDQNIAISTTPAAAPPSAAASLFPRDSNVRFPAAVNTETSPDESKGVTPAKVTSTSSVTSMRVYEKAGETASEEEEEGGAGSRSSHSQLGGFMFVKPRTQALESDDDNKKYGTGPGSGTDLEQCFIANGDVLY